MRLLRLRFVSVLVCSSAALVLGGIFGGAFAADSRVTRPKNAEVVTVFPKALQGVAGKLELYGTISAVNDSGVVLSITKVDKEYAGNEITRGMPYFGDVKDNDPEAWLRGKKVQLLWQTEGFNNDQHKKTYTDLKAKYKAGQSVRIMSQWSEKQSGVNVLGATWFGEAGKRGARKART